MKNEKLAVSEPTVVDDEIDLRDLFRALNKQWLLIVIITLLVTAFAVVYAYFSTNIYQASATVEITDEQKTAANLDMMSLAMGMDSGSNIDNEIEIIRSRFIAQKALEELNIGTRYFTEQNFKVRELYKDSPVIVTVEDMIEGLYGVPMLIKAVDDNQFELSLHSSFTAKVLSLLGVSSNFAIPDDYQAVHGYGEKITTPWFTLTVEKIHPLVNVNYVVSHLPNSEMYQYIQKSLAVKSLSKASTLLSISFKDNVPMRARDVVNALTQAYLTEELNRNSEEADKVLAFIDLQLESINESLQVSAVNLEQYKITNNLIDLGIKAEITATSLSELEQSVYTLDIEQSVLESVQAYITKNQDLSGLVLGSSMENSSLERLIGALQEAMNVRESLLTKYTNRHPEVLKLAGEVNELKKTIISTVDNKLAVIKDRKKSLNKIISAQKSALEALPEQEKELAKLTRHYMVNEKIYSYLLEKRAETAIQRASTVSNTRVLDAALVPDATGKIKPKRGLIVAVGFILGLMLGLFTALVRNVLNNKIETVEELEKLTNLPVYGVLPKANEKDIQPFYESLRVLRTNLQFVVSDKKAKVVSITSSISGEGKTTVVVDLAKIIAQSDCKVIILDLDLRRSRLHERLEVSNKVGMSTLLSGKNKLEEVIQSAKDSNFDLVTGGPMPPNPSELLMTTLLEETIAALAEQYDYIILDTAPVGLVTDAMMSIKLSDISLFVFKANYSHKEFVQAINRLHDKHEIQNFGLVLNCVETGSKLGYGYGYGQDYNQS